MLRDQVICRKGDTLTAQQCRWLKYFEVKLAEFRMVLDAMYDTENQKMVEFEKQDARTRALEHLTYNHITLEDGDYNYQWLDEVETGAKVDSMNDQKFNKKVPSSYLIPYPD